MSKKLLGNRTVGDKEYLLGQVISDEEATAVGFDASDVSNASDVEVKAETTEGAKVDADADEMAVVD